MEAVRPKVLVCLGASAAQSLIHSALAPAVIATVHPSSILRARDAESREKQLNDFVRDLKIIAKIADEISG